jgi:hypothetical protein
MAVGSSDPIGDGIMPAGDVQELAHTYCGRGVPVQLHIYGGYDHGASLTPFDSDGRLFMQQRYAGQTPTNGCASIGPGNPLTPLPEPSPVQPSTGSSPTAKRRKCRRPQHKGRKRKCHKKAKRLPV